MTSATLARPRRAARASRPRPAALARPLVALLVATLAVAAGGANAADTLYRWSEPDGSLTYSPTAPTDGTAYVTVDAMTMQPVGADAPANAGRRISRASGSDTTRAAGASSIVASAPSAPTTSAASTFTDPAPLADGGQGRSPALGAASRPSANPVSRTVDDRSTRSTAYGGTSEKERRCGELEKRVISLERRLSSPLTPEAMDDTVVQMARYQQNVDRHCR